MRALWLLALLPSVAATQDFSGQTYTCDRDVQVPATYVNTAEGNLVVIHVDGHQITLLAEPAASGARYGWPSDGSNYVWWTQGDGATLYWKTPEGEDPILSCTATQS